MIFIIVFMTVTYCETAALVIQAIIWVINLIKSGSSNFSKDLPLFHPVYWFIYLSIRFCRTLKELDNQTH